MKTCTMCKQDLPLNEFHFRNKKLGTYKPRCKTCRKQIKRQEYSVNRKRILKQTNEYYVNHRDWYKEYHKQRMNNKRLKDPQFQLYVSYKSMLSKFRKSCLKGNMDDVRSNRLKKITGKSKRELFNYLCETFEFNYGIPRQFIPWEDIEIDHIIPLFTCDSEQNAIELNHYTNLQLLFKEDNRNKCYLDQNIYTNME